MARTHVGLCWIFAAPLLAGILMIAVLLTPALANQAFLYIPVAATLGLIYGFPLARVVSRFLQATVGGDPLSRWGWGF